MSDILFDIIELVADIIVDSNNASRRRKRRDEFTQKSRFTGFSGHTSAKSNPWDATYIKKTDLYEDKNIYRDNILDSSKDSNKDDEIIENKSIDSFQTESKKAVIVETPVMKQNQYETLVEQSKGNSDASTFSNETISETEEMDNELERLRELHQFSVTRVKLEILLLSYIYTEDDGKISFSEKSKLKSHFKSFKDQLNEEDLESVKQLLGMEPSLNNIRAHVNQNLMEDIEVNYVLDNIENMCGLNKDYKRIMSRIRKSLLNTINY